MISPAALAEFHAHALRDYPREACGLVVRSDDGQRYMPCRNLAQTPAEHFVLPAEDYTAAEDEGEVVAVLHSHPNGAPLASDADRVMCEASELPWGITALGGQPLAIVNTAWIAPCGYVAPLVGRTFAHGILDCYSLIRDCYRYSDAQRAEAGIAEWPCAPVDLPDFPRNDKWWEAGENLYLQHFSEAGFVEARGAVQIGDVIIMQIGRDSRTGGPVMVPNHAGVYIGEGRFLHHMYDRLSTREIYGGQWQERTRLIVRYAP